MSNNPKDHDFNWVEARRNCSFSTEYIEFKNAVKRSVEERRKDLPDDRGADVRFKEESNEPTKFSVHRGTPGHEGHTMILFSLVDGEILVAQAKGFHQTSRPRMSLTLNDQGECRYKIGDEGPYLRWQVVRWAVEALFYRPWP